MDAFVALRWLAAIFWTIVLLREIGDRHRLNGDTFTRILTDFAVVVVLWAVAIGPVLAPSVTPGTVGNLYTATTVFVLIIGLGRATVRPH